MKVILDIIPIIIFLILLWAGYKKIEFSNPIKVVLAFIDIGLLIYSVFELGAVGVWIIVIANIVAGLVYSVWLAMKKEDILTRAATQSGLKIEDCENLYSELSEHRCIKYLSPLQRANLIFYLSIRGRNKSEIKEIALVIAKIFVVHKIELKKLVDKYDKILRLWNKPAEKAEEIGDKITKASQNTATTFEEMMDGMIAFQQAV
jgi:hypothetical protein